LLAASLMKLILVEFQNPSELRERTYPKKQEAIDRFMSTAFSNAKPGTPLEWIGFLADDFARLGKPKGAIPAIATFLDEMSNIWSRHGATDFNLAEVLPDVEDRRALMREFHELNGDPHEFDPSNEYPYWFNWLAMWFCAKRLKHD
ncbi:MAG TPA: hypothetical protein V6C65_01695, partial [Allocoleopsis sp.]